MQKIIAVLVGVHEYVARPQVLLTEDLRVCPFCPDGHRLRSHGSYLRFAIVEQGAEHRIPVLRLLCAPKGRTLSLLPDFCLPGRQHGPAVLGVFLEALILGGLTLTGAIRRARPDAPDGHSLPQSLLRGFVRRLPPIRAWLANRRHRFPDLAAPPRPRPIEWVQTVAGGSAGASDRDACGVSPASNRYTRCMRPLSHTGQRNAPRSTPWSGSCIAESIAFSPGASSLLHSSSFSDR